MAYVTTVPRTDRNAVLELQDTSTTASNSIIFTGLVDDIGGSLQHKTFEPDAHRGTIQGWLRGPDTPVAFSVSIKVNEVLGTGTITNFDDQTLVQAMMIDDATKITSASTSGYAETMNMVLTLVSPVAAETPTPATPETPNETITWTQCVFDSIEISAGFPKTLSISGRGIAANRAYNAS